MTLGGNSSTQLCLCLYYAMVSINANALPRDQSQRRPLSTRSFCRQRSYYIESILRRLNSLNFPTHLEALKGAIQISRYIYTRYTWVHTYVHTCMHTYIT